MAIVGEIVLAEGIIVNAQRAVAADTDRTVTLERTLCIHAVSQLMAPLVLRHVAFIDIHACRRRQLR